jgi:tRNA A37 N6-isopentenylltransferase MiaA
MFAAGLVEETRGLLERYGPVKALDSLGYKQARGVLDGTQSVEKRSRRRSRDIAITRSGR